MKFARIVAAPAARSVRTGLTIGAVTLAGVVGAWGAQVPASASAPITYAEDADFDVPTRATTAACGFEVRHHVVGHFTVKAFRGPDGLVVREIDGVSDARDTWYAPSLGTSYSMPFNGSFRYNYPESATPGAPATLTFDALGEKVPGAPADAGRLVYEGVVFTLTPEGIPIVDTDPVPISATGHFATSLQDRCAALAGTS